MIRRRDFITLLGGAAAAWPVSARAQQAAGRVRRIGVLVPATADDAEFQTRLGAFQQELALLGWIIGRNVRIDVRWPGASAEDSRSYAAELVALAPDAILANGSSQVTPLLQATRSVPIVFVNVSDPVGAGYVESLSRPGGNATGFASFEYTLSGKWPELLKQIAPGVMRIAVLRYTSAPAGTGQYAVIQAAATSLGMDVHPINVQDAAEVERGIEAFARSPNGALIVTPSPAATTSGAQIIALAASYKLPTIYFERSFAGKGGLISYGPDQLDAFRRAAAYVDRILKGEPPANLPVQLSTKVELVVNLKSAKALGLSVPLALLARADEVIE
jgi:putative ABC transport system substrate-binding protein